ncbi:inositol polyphosphate multikinase [Diorhabda carinulata]|uniref:inositol polyphosphate multikinase n=1 Tax=Diorhabda carinulata TaxID=1163345 RepID=UPI0024E18881|nr:inositol polyphosphate multikinase isoform X2 [Diorhabda sublineata]XP_056634146.1 inositol polyphosphate multikinase isoform X2 [Diorhabda sublineata]XP_057665549.1 inositol polyphosphate multikinase [Diorhabda carinulata]
MGKSEVQSLPIHRPEPKLFFIPITPCKTMHHINIINGLKNLDLKEECEDSDEGDDHSKGIPQGYETYTHQMAGHVNDGKNIGMLKEGDTVLKPMVKRECGERELWFYENLSKTLDKTMLELKNFVPKYYGTKSVAVNGKSYDFIVLEDLIKDFKEPCIMDIKIGRRTWDPKASYEKICSEERKYEDCKRQLGFCIPGFQVYQLSNNQLIKFDKEFGKSLNKERAEDAIRTFLNIDGTRVCRSLIVQFLASLWQIQYWARNQRQFRLYSSSILLVYDARRLREKMKTRAATLKLQRKGSLYRPMSLAVLNKNNDCDRVPTGFSGQLTKEGPILKPQRSSCKTVDLDVPSFVSNNTWHKSIHSLKRTHSFQNNYDKDVQNKKQDYTYLLDELNTEQKSECWAVAKMIDFAHAFPAENCDIDKNYLDGIENLVRFFEELLIESD